MALNLQYGTDIENRSNHISFDSDAANYDRVRPRYCPELFEQIFRTASISSISQILEIGAGTGQATEPFFELGCSVTAVELGEHLADFLKQKDSDRRNFTVWQGDFLDFPEDRKYDLVFSATAFHWVPREQGFEKVKRLLKPGGTLALFWNHPIIGGDPDSVDNRTVQSVYEKFGRSKIGKIFDGSSCDAYARALRDAAFADVCCQLFTSERVLTGKEYVLLMRSYSDHIVLPYAERLQLEQEMERAIRGIGDALKIRDVMDLYLAKNP